MSEFPLTDWAVNDIDWTRQWLYMTVVDYYGAAVCLVVIALLNEPILYGVLWGLGFCLLGSPICCSYMIYRVTMKSLEFSKPRIGGHDSSE